MDGSLTYDKRRQVNRVYDKQMNKRMNQLSGLALAGTLAAGLAVPAAADDGLRERGQQVARDVCSGCHAIAEHQRGAVVDGAPSFPTLARSDFTEGNLRTALTTPHPVMPEMPLSEHDIEAVLAYIRSFAD